MHLALKVPLAVLPLQGQHQASSGIIRHHMDGTMMLDSFDFGEIARTSANATVFCRGDEAKPCAELEKEDKVQLLKVTVQRYAVPCCAALCHAPLLFVMLCFDMPCMLCHAHYAILCHAILCYAKLAILCSLTLSSHAMPCHVMSCHACMPCLLAFLATPSITCVCVWHAFAKQQP